MPMNPDTTICCNTELEDSGIKFQKYKFFILLECFIFAMNILAAVVFMIFRALFHNQVSWDIEEDDKWEQTDALIDNGEQIDLFQQVFAPAMISWCLLYTPFFAPFIDESDPAVKMMTNVFCGLQQAQVVLTLLCIFLPTHIFKGP